MSDDYDLEWDEAFGGDIDFDDDFDMDPYKNKGFFSSLASGFLSGVAERTVGSTEAAISTARNYLPRSFSNFFDNLSYWKVSLDVLVDEFETQNYQTVKSLQNIAGSISEKVGTDNSAIARKLKDFSEKDFSSWEAPGRYNDQDIHQEDVDDDDVNETIGQLIDSQIQSFQNVGAGINQMSAHVGGGIMAVGKANGRELIGIQAGIRDLISYQQNVQYKMDRAKIELLTRTYLVNAKFYKFMEKALHSSIFELKEITKNSKLSDYEKTSLYTESKAELRRGALGVVRRRVGGLIGQLTNMFSKDSRKDFYNGLSSLATDVEGLTGGDSGVSLSSGLAGQFVGDNLAEMAVQFLPYFINQGPVADSINKRLDNNPTLKNALSRLRDVGNLASYNSNNGLELINYFTQYWKEFDTNQYADYEDYVSQMTEKGETPLPKPIWLLSYTAGNFAKEKANEFMWGQDKSQGTVYTLDKREAADLTKLSYWKEINNITLNDVIPGLLTRIYESVEKFRTGDDSFQSPVFSYTRGQFVKRDVARQLVKNDVFNHSNFQGIALTAENLVNVIDPGRELSDEQRQKIAFDMIERADKQYGFNPYYYLHEMTDDVDADQAAINQKIFERFDIDEEKIRAFNEASIIERGKMAATGFSGDAASALNTLGDLSKTIKNSIPDVTRTFLANRQAGNDQFLRELGLIYTRNGIDVFDEDAIFNRIKEYLKDPYNPLLRGDLGDQRVEENPLSPTRPLNIAPSSPSTPAPGESQAAFDIAVNDLTKTVSALSETLANVDFGQVNVNLDPIPDKLDSLKNVLDSINSRDDKQFALIEKISVCVNRQAEGWGDKSDNAKKQILEEEGRGKKTLMDRLRSLNPRNLFNKSIETLINNQPLILGGILGGLGTLALHDPKAAAFAAGGIAIATAYGRLRRLSEGQEPDDDENILDENGEVLLSAAKLRNGDYFDQASKAVIKSWRQIKGAVFDLVKKTYITVAQLSGRIFGPDGRALIIKGLSKARDLLNSAWNKIDIVGNARRAFDKGKEVFYQQDVYVRGRKDPSLTRSGFMNGKYYCYDLKTQQPVKINGWNEIEGPVYELSPDGTLNQVVSEADIAQGLITSAGVAIDKLKSATSWLGKYGFDGLMKARDYSLKKAGVIKDKAVNLVSNDYSGIESRIDRIYLLLCEKFGVEARDIDITAMGGRPNIRKASSVEKDILDDVVDQAKERAPRSPETDSRVKDKFSFESRYPNKIRLNSFEDQEEKQEQKKKDQFYDDIHAIREDMDGGLNKADGKEEKKGLFGKLASLLGGGFGLLKKMFTNPIGFMFDMTGKMLSSIFIKSPMRLAKIGSLLFSGVLGLASPIYKLLKWGLNGVIWGIRKLLFKEGSGMFSDIFGRGGKKGGKGKGKTKSKTKGKRSAAARGAKIGRGVGWIGKAAAVGLTAYELFGGSANASERTPTGMSDYQPGEDTEVDFDDDYDDLYSSDQDDEISNELDQNIPDNRGLDYNPMPNANVLQTVGETAAYAAAPALSRKAAGIIAAKMGAKLGSRAVPGLGEVLMTYDAAMGYLDEDQVSDTFDTNYISRRQREANAVTSLLSFGDTLSGVGRGIAGGLGIDSLAEEGGLTRLVEKGLEYRDKLPITMDFFIPNFETDVSKPQRKVRLAMYGLQNTDNALGRTIEILEHKLGPYVRNSNNNVWIDEKAPVKAILGPLLASGDSARNVEDIYRWYRYRFEPVFKLWYSAVQVGQYANLADFDRSELADVLAITKQVNAALVTITPYPLDIVGNIDPTTQLMQRQEANGVIHHYLTELINAFKDRGVGEDGLLKLDNKIRTREEVEQGVSEDTGIFASLRNHVQSWGVKADEYLMPSAPKVLEIDISDLHKSGSTTLDDLTMLRLSAYGNSENNPVRVDTVLRLERYCEQFFAHRSTGSDFTGNVSEIYNLFKNSFGTAGITTTDMWMGWFNGRFIPVLTVWVSEIYRLRKNTPKLSWTTLSDTNRLDIAIAIRELKTVSMLGDTSIWTILQSPFPGTWSSTDDEVAVTVIKNLQAKKVQARLNDPEKEDKLSKPIDFSETQKPSLTPEQERALIDKASGQTGIGVGDGSGAPAPTSQTPNRPTGRYADSPPATLSYSDHFKHQGQGADATGSVASPSVNAPPAFPKNNTQGVKPNPGDDAGFSMDPKMGEQIILRELIRNGITDPNEQAFVLANVAVETGNYKRTSENMNYNVDQLMKAFKRVRDKGIGYAKALVSGGRRAIAEGVYKNWNGNKEPGDGWLYKGRGFIQLTGRGNYEKYGKGLDVDIVKNPRLVSDNPDVAAQTAISFISKRGVLKEFRDNGFNDAVKAINGGYNGLEERKSAYKHYQQLLSSGALKPQEEQAQAAEDDSDSADGTETQQTASADAPQIAASANDTAQEGAAKTNAPPENEGSSGSPTLATPSISVPDTTPKPEPTPEVNTVKNDVKTDANTVTDTATPVIRPEPRRQPEMGASTKQEVTLPDGIIRVQDESVVSAIAGLAEVLTRALETQGPSTRRVGVGPRQ